MEKKNKPGKGFKCNRCEYAATQSSDLKKHVLAVHDKVKNLKCELCEYVASYSNHLRRHVRSVHAKEKNFKCEQCEYAASEAATLKSMFCQSMTR